MRKNPPAKWPLPLVVNPTNTRCIEMHIPDDPAHIAAFRGAMLMLASAYNWADDPGHTAKDVALVWREVIDNSLNWGCNDMQQTLLSYDDPCALKWSYDNGAHWTEADLSGCADSEIMARVAFRVVNDVLEVSLDGGATYGAIYDAKAIATTVADAEIAAQILFRTVDNNLEVSLDGGATYSTIYDAVTIATTVADAEIAAQILFRTVDNNLEVSLDGGATYSTIYDAATIADAEIESRILFVQDGPHLAVSLDGDATEQVIFNITDPATAIAEGIEHIQDVGQDVDNPNILRKKIGGEWLQFADLSLASGIIQPAPAGTIPAGTCKYANLSLIASQKALIPVAVYGGYQITVVGDYGGATDGLLNWYCIDGRDYVLGQCQGSPEAALSSDPMPTKYHMELIMLLPDNTYTTMRHNEPYIVPSGMTNGYYQLLLNDGNLSDNSGSFQLTVEICAPLSSNYVTLTYDAGSGPAEVYEGQEFTVNATFHPEYGGYGQFVFHLDKCAHIQWISGNVNGRSGGGVDMNWASGCGDPAYYVEYGGGSNTVNAHQGENHEVDLMTSTCGLSSGPFVFRVASIP